MFTWLPGAGLAFRRLCYTELIPMRSKAPMHQRPSPTHRYAKTLIRVVLPHTQAYSPYVEALCIGW